VIPPISGCKSPLGVLISRTTLDDTRRPGQMDNGRIFLGEGIPYGQFLA
jgi:hypothetical protein